MPGDRRYQMKPAELMRVLSIRQPWLWAILHADKRVENRDWAGCDYRGPILLHASKGCGKAEFRGALSDILFARGSLDLPEVEVPPLEQLPRGVICGIARISNVERHPAGGINLPTGEPWGYRMPDALGLELADVRELPPVPLKGALGFWPASHDQIASVAGFEVADMYRTAWRELEAAARRAA